MDKLFNSYVVTTRPRFKFYKSAVSPWLGVALNEIGVQEVAGSADNPRILEYWKSVPGYSGTLHDEVAWCSVLMNFCFDSVGIVPTRSAAAKSWMSWGVELKEPRFGCVAVFDRGAEAWMGHVGLVLDVSAVAVQLVSGNVNNRVGITAESLNKLRGYRWPV